MFLLVSPEEGSHSTDWAAVEQAINGRSLSLGLFDPSQLTDRPRTPPLPDITQFGSLPHRSWWRFPHDDLRKRNSYEHLHTEAETIFCTEGSFLLVLNDSEVLPPLVLRIGAGCWYHIPKRTKHWLLIDPVTPVAALTLYADPTGWMPYFTQSGIELQYESLLNGLN